MYNHFEGRITEKTPTYAVIDCGGVGYLLHISLNTYSKIGSSEKARLYAHLAVREDAHVLYGFADEEERELFRHLISVSGVGPGTARMILSSLTASEIAGAILTGNVAVLKGVKGIGEKSAQRIIVDLKGKLGKSDTATATTFFAADNKLRDEALSALVMLGFARNLAEKAVDKVLRAEGNVVSVEQLIKLALKNL
ncbi:MAG: Holliday junction branch migration protein RuvA [Bacteroidia bacterium]|jgi:Holliday junction DNA helicase RuvA|nr:Holliday junction branch migration protein RuvA [Bacteroidia bacterium]